MPSANKDPVHIEESEPRAPESAARSGTRRKSRRRLGRTARLRRRRALAPLKHQDIYELTDDDINLRKTPYIYWRYHSDIEDYILEFKITKTIRKDGKLLRTYVRMTKEFNKDGELEDEFHKKDEIIYKDFFPFETPESKFFKTLDDAVHYSFKGHKERVEAQEAALGVFKGESAPKENYHEE